MAAVNGQLAASGLVGALTSLFIEVGSKLIPDGNLKSIISVMAGMTASLVAFEILSWFAILRLKSHRKVMSSLIPSLQDLQSTIQGAITHQMALMKQNNATAADLKDVEKLLVSSAEDVARVLMEIQKRSIDIVRDINR